MSDPRLPSLPVVPYDPPRVIPSPEQTAAGKVELSAGQEIFARDIPLPCRGVGNPGHAPQVSVYTTQGAWRACDVFVQVKPPTGGLSSAICVSVFVYAVSKGARTLVASGRQAVAAAVATVPVKWIAAARTIQQQYEVCVQATQFLGAPVVLGTIAVTVAASNEAVDAPAWVGLEELGSCYLVAAQGSSLGEGILNVDIPDSLELVQVRGNNGAAAARFLMLIDSSSNNIANGTTPLRTWPLGAVIGAGLADFWSPYRCTLRVQLVQSSTIATLTKQTDGIVGALVR